MKEIRLITVGINHMTAPVEEREQLSFSQKELPLALRNLTEIPALQEGVILSTCNRVEIYGLISDLNEGEEKLKHFLCRTPKRLTEMNGKLYTLLDEESVTHLFTVASGIDSMVLGESEILGQVKLAYQEAVKTQTTGKIMHALFQKSFQTAKIVRGQTEIGRGMISVSSIAVSLAKRILGNLNSRRVMILGAGKMSQSAARALKEEGVSSIIVSNRNYDKAKELAESFQGEAVTFDQHLLLMQEVDIVISSTSAPHFILSREKMAHLMRERKQRPLFLLDIAVPRDIDPTVNQLDNVYLYDIDDLQEIAKETLSYRENQLTLCHALIHQKAERFMTWFHRIK